METLVRTPQAVFMLPQRLVVPLFQRQYVWNEREQWAPLWDDVVRVADRVLERPHEKHSPHFLGAVVLQQIAAPTGLMQQRTIIDGQQRLTTLQLLLDALHAELVSAKQDAPALRLEGLVTNSQAFCSKPEDRFKVWPTNRDRPAFNAVMGVPPPVDHDAVGHKGERMVEAHRYFCEEAREWLPAGPQDVATRALAIEAVVRELLQMVVIDLGPDENAQEIFETLNARGTPLTAADLIKNFVFQRLQESNAPVEDAYERNWKEFETAFWETEVGAGRVRYPRSSIFLNHWLIARTGKQVVASEVFTRFKRFADGDDRISMARLLDQIHGAAAVYRHFVDGSESKGHIERPGLFGYRTGVLESEVIKPLILYLLDPLEPAVPESQIHKVLDVIESWMVRRMLVRATTKAYNKIVADLVTQLRQAERLKAGDVAETFLASQTGASQYWPDDQEIRTDLRDLPIYRRIGRGRLRMVLEAVEDHYRGWKDGKKGLGGERVPRRDFHIEHVMPRKWTTHWPLPDGSTDESGRDQLIHTLGNLTLLTEKLNARISNGPWLGEAGKREAFKKHVVSMLTREFVAEAGMMWTDDAIRARTDRMIEAIIEIWPVPDGHRSAFSREKARPQRKVDLLDLINAGLIQPGMSLIPRPKKHVHRTATLLPDGKLDVEGVAFASPSTAAVSITGKSTNGWSFFLVDPASRRRLKDVRRDYVEGLAVDVDEDDDDDGDDEES